ncbi:hypothetical protein Tco_0629202 [Tanacetum coccineum]|uniref:Reverse transcriptase domain-containing protein n=1 Tax=Tanacetum coccineum TaxID=301880 RepID=A0ABQ4WSG2_9ASTR
MDRSLVTREAAIDLLKKIIAKVGKVAYKLELPDDAQIHLLHGGYVDCGNDVWRMQGSLGVSRAIGDKHLAALSDIHNGCSTQPRHTSSVITSNVHCHRKDATRCQQQTNHLYAQQEKPATQFRCSRQKKIATKPNCGQQQQVEADVHPGKANVVADALSRKERVNPKRVIAMNMTLQSSIKDRILAAQKEASDESVGLQRGLDEMIELRNDGALL